MPEGVTSSSRRLPFAFHAQGAVGKLALGELEAGPLLVDRLELEVTDLGTDPGVAAAERFQRRRTRLRTLAVRLIPSALEARIESVRRPLAGLGITQLSAKLNDGFVSLRARAADGLAAADLSFRIQLVSTGPHLRALASTIRVHGHLPAAGPIIADRILVALFGATEAPGVIERPHARGLCDVEIDLVGGLLWHLMPPSGWRLPAVTDVELTHVRITRAAVEIAYGPAGSRTGDLGVRVITQQLAAAHDLMHSVDQQLRDGHLEEAMRGYRALLAAGGPDQPHLLERILALAAARPTWFFDGLELARQALGRWPQFPAAHTALTSITLAQGDAREAAAHLTQIAQLASAEGDDDQAALAALAGARLLRVLDPRSATQLYQLALEHDPASAEAADSLADRLADEQRWPEFVRLVRARVVITADVARAVQLRLRLADVFVHQLEDPLGAQHELAAARELAPDDPSVHEMTATIMSTADPAAAIPAWREVARLAEARGDHRTCARAFAILGALLAGNPQAGGDGPATAEDAWRRALELDPLQTDAIAGLATAAAERGEHAIAAELFERLRGLGLPQPVAARYELVLARSMVALGRTDEARSSLRRASMAGGETAAEAHAILAEIAEATGDREHAALELEVAIGLLVQLGTDDPRQEDRMFTRASQLAMTRAALFDRGGHPAAAALELQRAHELAELHAPAIARDAARALLARADDAGGERRWIDAVLATRPPPAERGALLVRRAEVRRREHTPDLAAAIADLHEALALTDEDAGSAQRRRRAYELEADLLSASGDKRARAQALAAIAKMAELETHVTTDGLDRIAVETAAAAAWLGADEPASALPHIARAYAELEQLSATLRVAAISGTIGAAPAVPSALRLEVLTTLGEAAWRQRAWPDVIRAYRGLLDEPGVGTDDGSGRARSSVGMFRYRLAVAADRTGAPALAAAALQPLIADSEAAAAMTPELLGQALRLFADLAERAGDLAGAAAALESFASLAVESSASARADAMYRAGELFRRSAMPAANSEIMSGGHGYTSARGDDAIRCLEAALRLSDTHLPALDALELAWRERGDLDRVSVILGRKVAAMARHPQRQKPLLSRLGDLQDQLERPDVALATHQRALEIDPAWRPSLRYVTLRLASSGQIVAAVGGLAQLAGELPGDVGVDSGIVIHERQLAVSSLAALVLELPKAQLDAVRELARPALERAIEAPTGNRQSKAPLEVNMELAAALARLRGEKPERPVGAPEENTQSGRLASAPGTALSLRDAATRARAQGKLDEAFASLETANHVNPGDPALVRELVELAGELGDQEAVARHLAALAELSTGARRGDVLLELADVYYDKLDDTLRGRQTMRAAADAFGAGARNAATLRMLATEASAHLAWDVAVDALTAIAPDKRTVADVFALATGLQRAGRDADAIALVEASPVRLADDGELLAKLRAEADRKAHLARQLAHLATQVDAQEAESLREEARAITDAIGQPADVTDPAIVAPEPEDDAIALSDEDYEDVTVTPMTDPPDLLGQVAASADRQRLISTWRDTPDDPALLSALLAHLGDREPALRFEVLDQTSLVATGRAQAIALHELAEMARVAHEPVRAAAMWTRAHHADASYAPVWMPLADVLASADDLETARELYERVAQSSEYDAGRRSWARSRAEALSFDDSIVSGEIVLPSPLVTDAVRAAVIGKITLRPATHPIPEPRAPGVDQLARARELAEHALLAEGETARKELADAIEVAELAAEASPTSTKPLVLLEQLYRERGDTSAASEAIGRQLVLTEDPVGRAALWVRRAKLYHDALDRDAQVYRCLKEAQACAPADPDIAYQLRTTAMVRGDWALAASLLYREIASSKTPRERGALHLELALIYEERLDDAAQAQVNYEQALAFDPTIPAAKVPLARRYEALGRHAEAARLYDEAVAVSRAADRGALIDAAERNRIEATTNLPPPSPGDQLASQLDRAEAAGDTDAALELAHQLWRADAGHPAAFRVLANVHRTSGDLVALTELTSVRTSRSGTPEERATAWLDVARLGEELAALDQAARAYDLALIEDPGHTGALDARGALAFRLGDFATADLIYRDLGPGESLLGDDELAHRRSIIAEQLGRDTEALAQAQAATVAAPGRRDLLSRVQILATRIGELPTALAAARAVLDLIPLDDDEAQLATHFSLVELLRQAGDLGGAAVQLDRIVRDHPHHAGALEALAEVHIARGDWATATRYLYQLVPLAPTTIARADRLYRLGEAVLVHLGDVDRADDVFLRASDLDPGHLPTLRRLLDVYWRADDPGALVEVATELVAAGALATGPGISTSLAHALIAAALVGETTLATSLCTALGDDAPRRIVAALTELVDRDGRMQLASASTAITELGRRGLLDLAKLRAAAVGTPASEALLTTM